MHEVVVKGWRNGLLLILPPFGDWPGVIEQVHTKLDEAKARSFWRGAQTTIDCGMRSVTSDELSALTDRMKRGFGLVPVAVVAADGGTRAVAERLALTVYTELPVVKKPTTRDAEPTPPTASANGQNVLPERTGETTPPEDTARPASASANALYLPGTVRSGQRVIHEGHLIICGDVNAGAEVMAGGDVVVLGTLRGLAHAGCYGDETARIVAGNLRPPQLRIAGKIARAPEESPRAANPARVPEVARIEAGEIGVFPL